MEVMTANQPTMGKVDGVTGAHVNLVIGVKVDSQFVRWHNAVVGKAEENGGSCMRTKVPALVSCSSLAISCR